MSIFSSSGSQEIKIVIYTALSGACIPLGGVLATFDQLFPSWLKRELRHFVIALGGGIIVGALSFVLIPVGLESLENSYEAISVFFLGGVCFLLLEWWLGLHRRVYPQLMGMLLDYVPESLALGGLFATGSKLAPLLAMLIGMQNVPEGFNAYRELRSLRIHSATKTLGFMCMLVVIGPAAGFLGYYFLSQYVRILGMIMLFFSGGILYLIFQDIAPQSKLNNHWAPPFGAVVGFSFSMFSKLLVESMAY